MVSSKALLQVSALVAAAHAIPSGKQTIKWGNCTNTFQSPVPVDCSHLDVPLDYTKKACTNNKTLKLELLRAPAPTQPSKGSILLNFGGPGEVGRATLASLGALLQAISGGQYDLISFDPRGTGSSIPFNCFESEFELQQFAEGQVHVNVTDEMAMGREWAGTGINAALCALRGNETGELLGTAFVARDMMRVVDALDEDGMLRYWGFSYGTTLGATLVSMFPDRIDKVVLDGVQNPHEYYHALGDYEEWTTSDDVVSEIFSSCAANPDVCALARKNSTGPQLEQGFRELRASLRVRPVAVGSIIMDDSLLNSLVAKAIYATTSWPAITSAIDMLITGDVNATFVTELVSQIRPIDNTTLISLAPVPMGLEGIHCGDRTARSDSYEEMVSVSEKLYKKSAIMGGADIGLSMVCAQWKLKAKEVYMGDFQVTPKNPVLLIGNTWDSHTPLISARNVSSGFKNSGVLEVQGYGHTSLVLPSVCSLKAQVQYWLTGELPNPGTACKVDAPGFSKLGWADVIKEVRDDKSDSAKRSLDAVSKMTPRSFT